MLLKSALSSAEIIRLAIQQMDSGDPRMAEQEAELSRTDLRIVELQEKLAAQAEAAKRQEEMVIPG